jgi:hypothetical protein
MEDLMDLFADGVPDAFDGGDLFGGEIPELFGKFFQCKGGYAIGFCLKGIFSMDIHEFGQQAELVGDKVVVDVHGTKLRKERKIGVKVGWERVSGRAKGRERGGGDEEWRGVFLDGTATI